jgi:RecB family exonuclease
MAERLNYEQLEQIKKEMNVFDIYSFSKVNLYKTDPYSYFLKYILKVPEDKADSIYSSCGTIVHDLTEQFQADEISREAMVETYNDKTFELEQLGFKFDRTDEDKNEAISKKYHTCNIHFLNNFRKIEGIDGVSESSVIIKVGKFLFVGYIDYQHIDIIKVNDYNIKQLYITDFKTSTIYSKDKAQKEKMQLLLYALGHIQNGWDINNIKARWCFTKYINVDVMQKKKVDGINAWNSRQIERNEIGSKLSASAQMWLKDTKRYSEEEINDFIVDMLVTNSIDNLPNDVKDKFKISDCYVYIDITKEEIDELVNDFVNTIHEMKIKEGEYARTKNDKVFWTEINKDNEYFLAVLSGYSPKIHKPYFEYLKQKELDSQGIVFSTDKGKVNKLDDDDIDIAALLAELEE